MHASCCCPGSGHKISHPIPPQTQHASVQAHEHASELNARPQTLCVAGDSAGGNLSAVVALMARDKGAPHVAMQLLVSPVSLLSASAYVFIKLQRVHI